MKASEETSKRPYRMKVRAEAAAVTGERIPDAAVAVFWERPVVDISLEEVARRAGVAVQTVIRRFGGKEGLFAAAAEREIERITGQRDHAPVGDVQGAVGNLLDHYEELGVRVLRNRWCAYGTVRNADSAQLQLPDGTRTTAPIFTTPEFDVDFYAYCSLGDQPAHQVTALDTNGNIIDVVPETNNN